MYSYPVLVVGGPFFLFVLYVFEFWMFVYKYM